mmetsp:Transcript_28812/g.84452  ORF Transcript_28812/g.84452 Transcript_28812/m.84452 type:complete len:184 (+) Transcript_28812:73-624(+)
MPLLPTHPKGYTSIYYPLGDAIKKFAQEYRHGGLFHAVNRLRQMNQLRLGRLVGEDTNGNKYYENTAMPYGRTRWYEPKVPLRIFEMDQYYDPSQVTPEWHGWLHYVTDKPGPTILAEHGQPWLTPHLQNSSIERETAYHAPGHWKNKVPRGRVGPKYESWNDQGQPRKLRNFSDNSRTLRIE